MSLNIAITDEDIQKIDSGQPGSREHARSREIVFGNFQRFVQTQNETRPIAELFTSTEGKNLIQDYIKR